MARTKKQNPHTYSPPTPPPTTTTTTTPYSGRGGPNAWNTHEKSLFQQGVILHGWGTWRKIEPMISTRTRAQIKSHAQKFKIHHPKLVKELERRHRCDNEGRATAANGGGGSDGVASSTMKSAAAAKRRRDHIKMKKKEPVIDIYNDANIANAIRTNDDGDCGVTPPTPRRNKRSMALLPPAAAAVASKKKKKKKAQQQSPDSIHVMVTDDTNKSIMKQTKYKSLSSSSPTKPHYCNKAKSGTVAISKVKAKVKVQPKMNKALPLPLPLCWSTSRSIASSNSSSSPLRRIARKTSKCSSSNTTPSLHKNNNNVKHTISTPTKKARKNNEVTIQRYNATAPFRILHPVDVLGMKKNESSPTTTDTTTTTTPGGTTGKPTSTNANAAANAAVNVNISSPSSSSNAVNSTRSITVVTPTDSNSRPGTTTTTNDDDSIHQEENDDELAVLAASVADIHPEEKDDNDDDGGRKKEGDTLDTTARQILPPDLAWLEQCSSTDDNEQFDKKFDNDIMSIDLLEDTIDALSLSSSFGSMMDNDDIAEDDEVDEDEYEPHQLFDIKNDGGNGNGGGVDDLNLKIDDEDIAGMLSSFLMNPTSSSSENNNKDDEKDKLMEEEDHHPSGDEEDNGHIARSSIVPRAQELGAMDPSLPGRRRSSYYYNYFGQGYNHSSFMTTASSRRDPPALAPTTTPSTPPQHPPILLTTPSHHHYINKVRPDPNAYHSIHAHLTSAPDYNNPKEYVVVRSSDNDNDNNNGLVSRMGREKGELCRARLRDYLIGEHLEVEWWKKNGGGAAAAAAADSNSHWYHCHENNLNDSSARSSSSSSSALASTGGGGRTNGDNTAAWTASVIMALPPPLGQSGILGAGGEVLAQKSSSSSIGGSSIGGGSSETLCKRELLNFNKKSALERLIAITAVMTQVDHWHTLSMTAGSVTTTTSATTTSVDGTATTTLLVETAAAARRFNEEDDIRAIGQLVKGLWERVNRSLGRDNYTLLGNSSGVVGDDNDCIFARMERNDAINSMVMRLDLLSRQE